MSSSEILEITTKPMVINDSSFTVQDRGITTFKPRSVVFEFDNYAPIACDLDYLFNVSERKIEYLCKNGIYQIIFQIEPIIGFMILLKIFRSCTD